MINKKILAAVAALLLTVPVLAVAKPINVGPVAEQVVEGHTVFTVLEQVTCEETESYLCEDELLPAAAVAVLVREKFYIPVGDFNGVLWFNDQYLVDGAQGTVPDASDDRHPCGGAVVAVNKGHPDPTYLVNEGIASLRYEESYQVTDPNDHTWIIDKYVTTIGFYTAPGAFGVDVPTGDTLQEYPVWVVNTYGNAVFIPDDGKSHCPAFKDGDNDNGGVGDGMLDKTGYGPTGDSPFAYEPTSTGYCYEGNVDTTGSTAGTYCETTTERSENHPLRLYNAVLFFFLGQDDVVVSGSITHGTASTDTNGCQVGTEWACPNGDDNAEGNSHPFNPTDVDPATAGVQQGTHTDTHDTGLIDLYAHADSRPLEPVVRNWVFQDSVGSGAAFHGHA